MQMRGPSTRAGILSDMEHWGIETFFSICTTAAEHTPEIAQNFFIWPNFINRCDISGLWRIENYPSNSNWLPRSSISLAPSKSIKSLREFYPSLVCPHHGYSSRSAAGPGDVR